MTSRGLLKVIKLGGEMGLKFSHLTLRGKTFGRRYFFTEDTDFGTGLAFGSIPAVADFEEVPNVFDEEGLIRFLKSRKLID